MNAHGAFEGTLGATLQAAMAANAFDARTRSYDSPLLRSLAWADIPEQVYSTLVEEMHAAAVVARERGSVAVRRMLYASSVRALAPAPLHRL